MTLLFVVVLVIAEFRAYWEVTIDNELVVDNHRDEELEIHFSIRFPRLPCSCA